MDNNDVIYWIWFSLAMGVSNEQATLLLKELRTPKRIYNLQYQDMKDFTFLTKKEMDKLKDKNLDKSISIYEKCQKLKIHIIPQDNKYFPEKLLNIYAAPILIYAIGNLLCLNNKMTIGVIGTRNPSNYGRKATRVLSYELAIAGFTVVSGCALGIDAIAHQSTVDAKRETIAVLGCGLDINYPEANRNLKIEILKNKGAIITEYPPGTSPLSVNFPVRNRIISGLSQGVLITEAPNRSGALITAEIAIEQGKEVFCVPPHDLFDKSICGVVKYLRDGATPVYSLEDIIATFFMERIDIELIQTAYDRYFYSLDYKKRIENEKSVSSKKEKIISKDKNILKNTYKKEMNSNNKIIEPVVKDLEIKDITKVAKLEESIDISMLSIEQQEILKFIKNTHKNMNEIAMNFNLPVYKIMILLSELEINGLCINDSREGYKSTI